MVSLPISSNIKTNKNENIQYEQVRDVGVWNYPGIFYCNQHNGIYTNNLKEHVLPAFLHG